MANAIDLSNFSGVTTDDWKARVNKELKGKSYEDYLIWNNLDGFEIEAWQNQPPTLQCQLPPLDSPWKLLSLITETDAQAANKTAHNALMSGSEALWFTKPFRGAAKEVVQNGIDESIAPVFIAGNTIYDPFHSLLKTGNDSERSIAGKIMFDGGRLRRLGCSVVQELAFIISQSIEWCSLNGFNSNVYFKVANGSGYLTEIAKIRALRWLWISILKNENQKQANPNIVATNLNIGYSSNDEHTNILRATTSAMSAICGGAQYVMIEPWDAGWKASNEFSERITRNIQNLLKDESRMAVNLNPADGSFFIENLTSALASKAWSIVQEIESKGGFSKYAISGQLNSEIELNRSKLIDAYSSGSSVLLNVNKYNSSNSNEEKSPQKSSYKLLPNYLHLPSEIMNK
jgi:methylmalonyl-CoA mutase